MQVSSLHVGPDRADCVHMHTGVHVHVHHAPQHTARTGGRVPPAAPPPRPQVYGIDVGYNQLADRIRRDERVVVMEKFNLRHLQPADLQGQVGCGTLRCSLQWHVNWLHEP